MLRKGPGHRQSGVPLCQNVALCCGSGPKGGRLRRSRISADFVGKSVDKYLPTGPQTSLPHVSPHAADIACDAMFLHSDSGKPVRDKGAGAIVQAVPRCLTRPVERQPVNVCQCAMNRSRPESDLSDTRFMKAAPASRMRANLRSLRSRLHRMRRAILKLGDKSTNGGVVTEGIDSCTHHGTPITFIGAKVWCNGCKSEGVIGWKGPHRTKSYILDKTGFRGRA